jgi:D-glycero-alpha-D-manno-heptose-7-phosphate kinase
MIIVRSPLRITLAGVSTDLPSFYRRQGGFLVAAALDKYVYVVVTDSFPGGIHLRHAEIEHVERVDDVRHPIIREALRLFGDRCPRIEITTFADVPGGTGLGSSGSFTTALLRALHAHRNIVVDARELAEQACHIEIDVLGEPIGKQDQYIAALGGLTCLTFRKDGSVVDERLAIDEATRCALRDDILLFFTGTTRSASNILAEQVARLDGGDQALFDNIGFEMDNAFLSREALEKGDLPGYGRLLSAHWAMKRKRSARISNPQIDRWYELGLENGAFGGKLVGAGGGGFLMFCARDKAKLRNAMRHEGLVELEFGFDTQGTRVIAAG